MDKTYFYQVQVADIESSSIMPDSRKTKMEVPIATTRITADVAAEAGLGSRLVRSSRALKSNSLAIKMTKMMNSAVLRLTLAATNGVDGVQPERRRDICKKMSVINPKKRYSRLDLPKTSKN